MMPEHFIINPNLPDLVDGKPEVTGYGFGCKVIETTSGACLAKKSFDPATKQTMYWLKRATVGGDAGKLFNPHSPNFSEIGANRIFDAVGRGQYEFYKASQDSFDAYLRFLESGNILHLRHAERET